MPFAFCPRDPGSGVRLIHGPFECTPGSCDPERSRSGAPPSIAGASSRMTRPFTLACLLIGLAASTSGSASAVPSSQPFYLVPSTTTECQGIKNCRGTKGPWVNVPANGQATYLFGCPQRIGFIVAGTDALVSSTAIRVWFDDGTGGRIGPLVKPGAAPVLLFHAASDISRPGWFQPIIGCVSLIPKNKRSTTSAYGGVRPGSPGDLKAESIVPRVAADLGVQEKRLACPRNERAVSSWGAYGLFTSNPPDSSFDDAISIRTVLRGRRVVARFHLNRMFSVLAPRPWVQIGAVCEP
jgi:hypothetical protein